MIRLRVARRQACKAFAGSPLLVAALAMAAAASPAAEVRVHAIGYKHLPADAADPDAYREHLLRLAEEALEADARLPAGVPRVLLFPEDTALYALFAGKREVPLAALAPVLSRGGGNGAAAALAALFALDQPRAAYYRAKFPGENLSQARLGLLALTDTLYRTFYETFREIAIETQSWVVASANVAPAAIVTDPARAALLAGPEGIGRSCREIPWPCAYEASSPNVYNQAFVFDPLGRLAFNPDPTAREGELDGAVKKTYLVPIEQGPLERGKVGLDLAYGTLRQVRPIEIAGIRTGIVISKPGWMLDELGRLEAYDAELLLQPEAFSSWGEPVEDWSPDVVKQSNWQKVQKHGPFRYGALAELTGNFFDLVFDGQSHVVKKSTDKTALARGYVGQPPDVGWLVVAPWVVGDLPGEECDRPTLAGRRQCLAEVARSLAPGSGDPRENGYLEARATATLDFGPPSVDSARSPGIFGSNFPLDPSPGARQRNPRAVVGPAGETYVVWQESRGGPDQVRMVRIDPDGRVSESRAVAPRPVAQRFPQVAVSPAGGIHVVWQELEPQPHLVRASAPSFDGDFTPPLPFGAALPGVEEQWAPAIAADERGDLHAAWIGLSGGFDRLYYTRLSLAAGGTAVEETRALDDEAFPAPDSLAERLNNRWNPAIAVRRLGGAATRVAVAWSDFRNYAWDLYASVSDDSGESFSPHVRVDDGGTELERLQDDASVVVAPDGTVFVAWTDQAGRRASCTACPRQRRPDADVVVARLGSGLPNSRIDDTGEGLASEDRRGFSNQWRPELALAPDGRLLAVWQDHRGGNNDVYLAVSADAGSRFGESRRVDDTGDGPSNQLSPAAAINGAGTVVVVWQDDRDGIERIYGARGAL